MNFRILLLSAGVALASMSAWSAQATSLYFQGFETDASGWHPDTGGTSPGAITRTPSGGGALGLTAFNGANYAEVTNSPDSYFPGYGTGGYTLFGNESSTPAYPGGAFTESLAVYVNTSTAAPTNGGTPAFWIDAEASSTVAADADGSEHNFRLNYSGSDVTVGFDGGAPSITLDQSGWYTFQFLYSQGANAAAVSTTQLSVLDGSTSLGSATFNNNSDGVTLASGDLAGPGYLWLPVWQNGFSGDTLGIDDVRADTVGGGGVPEPAAWAMMLVGFGGVGSLIRRRRRLAGAATA